MSQGQIGAEPVAGLTPQARPLLVVELGCVLAVAGSGQRCVAGGVVAVPGPEVVGQLGVGREGGGVQLGGLLVELLAMADIGQTQAFLGVTGLEIAFEERGQLRLHRRFRLGLVNPLGRRIAPAGLFRTQLVGPLEGLQGLGKPAQTRQGETQV